MSAPDLEAVDLTLRLGAFALHGATLAVAPGEVLVLLGPNGAGKSVCLEAIAGFHRLERGHIAIAGREVTALPPEERRIGFVVQNFGLFPHLTVAENVALGRRERRADFDPRALLARFGIAHLGDARPGHLSPGEKQRTALARALAGRPDLFLFDEPFSALDAATGEALRDELARFLRASGIPVIFVTHDRSEARTLADRVSIIEAGSILQDGRATTVFERPASVSIARFLGFENLLEGRIAAIERDTLQVEIGSGRLRAAKPATAVKIGQAATLCIRAENIHLLPATPAWRPDLLEAHVAALGRLGPLWKVALDNGFALTAYALPQTKEACALAVGARVAAAIDPAVIHVIPR